MYTSTLIEAINLILNAALLVCFIILFKEIKEVLSHARNFIKIAELNAQVTDFTKERTVAAIEKVSNEAKTAAENAATVALKSAEEVKVSVEKIPVKVVEEIKRSAGGESVDSGDRTPVINVRPKTLPQSHD